MNPAWSLLTVFPVLGALAYLWWRLFHRMPPT